MIDVEIAGRSPHTFKMQVRIVQGAEDGSASLLNQAVARSLVALMGGELIYANGLAELEIPLRIDPDEWLERPLSDSARASHVMLMGFPPRRCAIFAEQMAGWGLSTEALPDILSAKVRLAGTDRPIQTIFVDSSVTDWEEFGRWMLEGGFPQTRCILVADPDCLPSDGQLINAGFASALSNRPRHADLRAILEGANDTALSSETFEPRRIKEEFLRKGGEESDESVYDHEVALDRCGGDSEILAELADEFRREANGIFGSLNAALGTRDPLTIEVVLRRARGSAAVFAAGRLLRANDALAAVAERGEWATLPAAIATLRSEILRLFEVLPGQAER